MGSSSSTRMTYFSGVGVVTVAGLFASQDLSAMPQPTAIRYARIESIAGSTPRWGNTIDEGSLVPSLQQLADLAGLRANWDSYGAKPMSSAAIASASTVVAAVEEDLRRFMGRRGTPWMIAPSPDGGVQVEWVGTGRKIEVVIDPDGSLSYLIIDRSELVPAYTEDHGVSLDEIRGFVEAVLTL